METMKAALAVAMAMVAQITPELVAAVEALGKAKHRVDFCLRALAKDPGYQAAQTLLEKAKAECEALEPKVAELQELLQIWQTEADRLRINRQARAAGRAAVRRLAGVAKGAMRRARFN